MADTGPQSEAQRRRAVITLLAIVLGVLFALALNAQAQSNIVREMTGQPVLGPIEPAVTQPISIVVDEPEPIAPAALMADTDSPYTYSAQDIIAALGGMEAVQRWQVHDAETDEAMVREMQRANELRERQLEALERIAAALEREPEPAYRTVDDDELDAIDNIGPKTIKAIRAALPGLSVPIDQQEAP